MIETSLTQASTAVLAYIRNHENVRFSELIEDVSRDVALDEATVKAAVLRLRSEGIVNITSDWIVLAAPNAVAAA